MHTTLVFNNVFLQGYITKTEFLDISINNKKTKVSMIQNYLLSVMYRHK